MTELSSSTKMKKSGVIQSSVSVSGISAVIIAACHIGFDGHEYLPVITTTVPIVIGSCYLVLDYFIHVFGFRTKEQLSVDWELNRKLKHYEKRISKYEENIRKAKELGLEYQIDIDSINRLKSKVNDIELAYGEVANSTMKSIPD